MRIRPGITGGSSPPPLTFLVVLSALLNPALVAAQDDGNQPPAAPEHTIKNHATAIVDPKHIFPTPLSDGKSFHFEEHGTISNHKGKGDATPGNDAFSFFMVDGTKGAVDNSFAEVWTVLGQHKQDFKLRKRAWDAVRRQAAEGDVPNDTFEPLQEKYQVSCAAGMSSEECKEVFHLGVENTIIKLPAGIGMGPYARIVSFTKVGNATIEKPDVEKLEKRAAKILERRQNDGEKGTPINPDDRDVYEVVTDYDFKAITAETKPKAEIQFRCDFSNLLGYWEETVAKPAAGGGATAAAPGTKEKRWWGVFEHWLEKVTTLSKSDEGNLEAKYQKHKKLFHFDKKCKSKDGKSELETSLDLDADLNTGLAAHYSYLLRGHILPLPSVDDAFAYFSIEPFFNMLLELKGKGVVTTTTGDVDIFKTGFPGLSIKGIIRIGPELEITGRLDASLEVSGSIKAGFDIKFPKAALALPHNHPEAQKLMGDPGAPEVKSPQIVPKLDAEISADGRLALTATPKLNFGISVLELPKGPLIKADAVLGIDNTVELGVSANAKVGLNTAASAEFCYWADYVYRVFIGARASFLDGAYNWGGDYDLATPHDPIALINKSCIKYGGAAGADSDNTESNEIPQKRAELAGRSSAIQRRNQRADISRRQAKETSLFGGLFKCPAEEEPKMNEPCTPFDEIPKSNSRRGLLERRQADDAPPTCDPLPVLFYNCKHFAGIEYEWTKVEGASKKSKKSANAIGICQNIKNGIRKRLPKDGFFSNSNSAILTYMPGGGGSKRGDACGPAADRRGVAATSKTCKEGNQSKWASVQEEKLKKDEDGKGKGGKKKDPKPDESQGDARWLSCDEFPFNSSGEGGDGAETACVSYIEQNQQGSVQGLIRSLRWKEVTYENWAKKKKFGKYKLVLHNYKGAEGNIGELEDPPLVPLPDQQQKMDQIIGAVNTLSAKNLDFNSGKNGVCFESSDETYLKKHATHLMMYRPYKGCIVKFKQPPKSDPAAGPSRRWLNGTDTVNGTETVKFDDENPATWEIEEIIIDKTDALSEDEAMDRLADLSMFF